jgi:hypothetical protein
MRSYSTWSGLASVVISEFGTVDRRNIEEWLIDSNDMLDNERATADDEGGTSINANSAPSMP